MEVRYYVSVITQYDFIAFHRPVHLPELKGKLAKFYAVDEFSMPEDHPHAQCYEDF
jgi:hypothetical protein